MKVKNLFIGSIYRIGYKELVRGNGRDFNEVVTNSYYLYGSNIYKDAVLLRKADLYQDIETGVKYKVKDDGEIGDLIIYRASLKPFVKVLNQYDHPSHYSKRKALHLFYSLKK